MKPRHYRVGELATLAGVTVRTLHHYDAIGLLAPLGRSAAGYRLYGPDDLLRLQQILINRALGMPLEQIRRTLDDPAFDLRAALLGQRAALAASLRETTRMLGSVDAALAELAPRPSPTDHTMTTPPPPRSFFDGFDPGAFEAEAEQRWGQTDAYRESARRTGRYGPEQWRAIQTEADALMGELAALMSAQTPPSSKAARALAERHRQHIDRWFYSCTPDMHAGLAQMYTADARFAATFETVAEGLAAYVREAIEANASPPPAP